MSDTLDPSSPFALPGVQDFVSSIQNKGEASGPQAVSPKGAYGTMQVMPGTAEAPGFGIPPASSLNDFARVGKDYAAALYRRYSGNATLASAAYNAGPSRVDQWIKQFGDPRSGEISDLGFASKIPFMETRMYASRVAGTPTQGQVNALGATPPPATPALQAPAAPANPLAPPAPAGPDPSVALKLLGLMVPPTHSLVPVDYDPWAVEPKKKGQSQ